MSAEIDLLPCPGCNGTNTRVIGGPGTRGGPEYWAGCDQCRWRTWGNTEAEAIAAWNRRAQSAEVEALRAEVERVTCELMDATTRADKLEEALRGVLPFVVSDVLEHCDGNKCREQWCAGCMGDEYAAEQVEMARAAAQEARALLRDQEEGK